MVTHFIQYVPHRLERPDLSKLGEDLLVDGGAGGEAGLLGGPVEEAKGGRLVVLAAEGVEELLGSEVVREGVGGGIGEGGMNDESFMEWEGERSGGSVRWRCWG